MNYQENIPFNLYIDFNSKEIIDSLTGKMKSNEWDLYKRIFDGSAVQRATEALEDENPELMDEIYELCGNMTRAEQDDLIDKLFKSSIKYDAEKASFDLEETDSFEIWLEIPAEIDIHALQKEIIKTRETMSRIKNRDIPEDLYMNM